MSYSFRATLWRWKGEAPASWVFVTLPDDMAFAIRSENADSRRGWGSVKVKARIGGTAWQTSLFPHKETGSYVLPLKVMVRNAEHLDDGDEVEVTLERV